jgi:thiamine diphosphokinase
LFARRLPAYILGHYLFALTPLQGLHYQGLRWPAEGMALPPFVARAARNALAAENASVHWHSGDGVIFTPPGVRVAWAG